MGGIASKAQLRMSFLRWAVVTVPLILLLGLLSARSEPIGAANPWYQGLAKPGFTPPDAAFPLIWIAVYIAIGVALAMTLHARGARGRGLAVGLFVLQFALHLIWPVLFFGAHNLTGALIDLIAALLIAAATAVLFGRIRTVAALLMLPYIVWLGVIGALTWRIAELNPQQESLVPGAHTSQVIG